MRPSDALTRHDEGDVDLMVPTMRSLQWLADAADAAEVLNSAGAVGAPGRYENG